MGKRNLEWLHWDCPEDRLEKLILPGETPSWGNVSHWKYTKEGIPYPVLKRPVVRSRNEQYEAAIAVMNDIEILTSQVERLKKKGAHLMSAKPRLKEEYNAVLREMLDLEASISVDREWEDEEIMRCKYGHEHFAPRHYYYYTHGFIEEKANGKNRPIRPSFRVADDIVVRAMTRGYYECRGLVVGKRRRFGATWLMGVADDLYSVTFNSGFTLFVTKDGGIAEDYIRRVDFYMARQPRFLKLESVVNTKLKNEYLASPRICHVLGMNLEEVSNGVIESILAAGPAGGSSESKTVGRSATALKVDEAGEIENLLGILGKAIDVLAAQDGLTRGGAAFIFSTVGEMKLAGAQFKRVWDAADAWEVDKLFLSGRMGTFIDECGNDKEEEAEATIMSKRDKFLKAGDMDKYFEIVQKFPLHEDDMWAKGSEGVFSRDALDAVEAYNMQYEESNDYPKYGIYVPDEKGIPRFVFQEATPSQDAGYPENIGWGQWVLMESPSPMPFKDARTAGVDPIDLEKSKFGKKGIGHIYSDITCVIWDRHQKTGQTSAGNVLAMYCGRPNDPDEAFYQILCGIRAWGSPQTNIERQKGALFRKYLMDNGASDVIAVSTTALSVPRASGTIDNNYGFAKDDNWNLAAIKFFKGILRGGTGIKMPRSLISEMRDYGMRNTDRAIALLAATQLAEELAMREKNNLSGEDTNSSVSSQISFLTSMQQGLMPGVGRRDRALHRRDKQLGLYRLYKTIEGDEE